MIFKISIIYSLWDIYMYFKKNMTPVLWLIKKILSSNKIKNVLDIGAGKWYASLFCASYGAYVDAVDNSSLKGFSYPDLLQDHPNIHFHPLSIETFKFSKMYDLVIMTNMVMFLNKAILLDTILPKIISSLSENGSIVLSFFGKDDALFTKTLSCYDVKDFSIPWLSIIDSFDKSFSEDHTPYWLHTHHIHYLVLQKKLGV